MRVLTGIAAALWLVGTALGDAALIHDYAGFNAGNYGSAPNQTYKSSPLVSPLFQVTTWNKSLVDSSKYIFAGFREPSQQAAAFIFSAEDLSLVYALPKNDYIADTSVQTFRDEQVLVVGQGVAVGFFTSGSCMILDKHYNLLYNVTAKTLPAGGVSDLHECLITPQNTMLVTIYITREADLSSIGGSANDTIIDAGFQEVDIVTGALLFSWVATDHYDYSESYISYNPGGWDWFHVNSIQKTSAGDYLISCHATHAILLINHTDGSTIWTLGGEHNQFTDLSSGTATNFAFQHDARLNPITSTQATLTLFDNHEYTFATAGCTANCSRGLSLSIDFAAQTVRVAQEFDHPASLASIALGGMQTLPSGNVIVGWGVNGAWTEHLADGTVVWSVQFAPWSSDLLITGIGFSYRVFRQDWVGLPTWPPSVAVEGNGTAASMAYVSWNGATEVRSWVVYTGSSPTSLAFHGTTSRQGFETSVAIGAVGYVQFAALDSKGYCLGKTAVVNVQTGATVSAGSVS